MNQRLMDPGIDASQGMLETALTQSKPNLSFCLMDIDNLDFGEPFDLIFSNSQAMIQWLDQPSLVPFLAVLPKQKQAEFRHLVIEKMINKTIQEDGRCFETFRRINLQAQK